MFDTMPPKVLMYSFKGGAGRTVTTANVAWILAARRRKKTLLVDLDVESAGTSVLFGLFEEVRDGACMTIQDALRGYFEKPGLNGPEGRDDLQPSRNDFMDVVWPRLHRVIYSEQGAGELRVLPARTILTSTTERRFHDYEGQQRFELLLQRIERHATAPEIVFLDSASGLQDGAMLGLQTCEVLVVFVRWTRQFILGTSQFLKQYIAANKRLGSRIRRVLIVPTAVPRVNPTSRLQDEIHERQRQLGDLLTMLNRDGVQHYERVSDWMTLEEPIRECAALKWDDRVFLMEDDPERMEEDGVRDVLVDYERLADRILEAAR